MVGIVEVLKARSAGYLILNGGCVFEYDFQVEVSTEVVEVELIGVVLVLEVVVEVFVGACTRSRTRKTAAIIIMTTNIISDVFDDFMRCLFFVHKPTITSLLTLIPLIYSPVH